MATGVWTLFLQYRVAQTVYRGEAGDGKKTVWLRSSIVYPQGVYRLEIVGVGKEWRVVKQVMEVGVGEWIDLDGNVCADVMVKDLSTKLVPKFKFD